MANGQEAPFGSRTPMRFTTADFRREFERVRRARKRNIAIAIVAIILVIAAIVAAAFVLEVSVRTVGDSGMEPVLSEGQSAVTVMTDELHPGAVVAYREDGGDVRFGRIVAKPGDWVSIAPDGTLAVSDSVLSADSAKNVFGTNASSVTAREVPDGVYYVLGDAEDATPNGLAGEADFVDGSQIVGKALVKIWPLTSVGVIE